MLPSLVSAGPIGIARGSCALGITIIAYLAANSQGFGQSSPLAQRSLTLQGDAQQTDQKVHLDVFGKPCVKFESLTRGYLTDKHIFDHIVSADNHCPSLIKLKICYAKTDRCVDLQLGSYQRKETNLGVSGLQYFQYDAKESF